MFQYARQLGDLYNDGNKKEKPNDNNIEELKTSQAKHE